MGGATSPGTRHRQLGYKQRGGAHAPPQGRYIRAPSSEHRRGLNAMTPVIPEDEFVHPGFLNVARFKSQYSFDRSAWRHIFLGKCRTPNRDLRGLTGPKLIGRLFRYLEILQSSENFGVLRWNDREDIGRDNPIWMRTGIKDGKTHIERILVANHFLDENTDRVLGRPNAASRDWCHLQQGGTDDRICRSLDLLGRRGPGCCHGLPAALSTQGCRFINDERH